MNASSTPPKDDTVFQAKIGEMLRNREPIPLEWEERSLRIYLQKEPDRPDLLQRLCAVLAETGQPVPLELEERTLSALVKIHPDRPDLSERLETVRVVLGKAEPREAVMGAEGQKASQTDVDFQAESRGYEEQAQYKDMDAGFLPILELVKRYSMTSVERMYAVYKSIEYLEKAKIPGSIVECGVWRGGSIMAALATLKALGTTDRDVYLFDTFEGLPEPDAERDVDMFGNRAMDGWIPHSRGKHQSNWAYASLEDVTANVASVGYPMERVHFVKGLVEDTIPDVLPGKIAFLRLDTDFYSSTAHEMKHLYPRLEKLGVLIIDDYGHFLGAREAVDEYFAQTGDPILLQRIDYSGRLALKVH